MFLSNPAKSLLLAISLILLTAGCRIWSESPENSSQNIAESELPHYFANREPDNYQCEIVVTSGGKQYRTRIARKGEWQRIDERFGESGGRTILRTDKQYLIDEKRKIYAEADVPAGEQTELWVEMTQHLLHEGGRPRPEQISSDDNSAVFRILQNEGRTEILIYVDKAIGMPVKQEFFSVEGETRELRYAMELANFSPAADGALFAVPSGSRKVSATEFLAAK